MGACGSPWLLPLRVVVWSDFRRASAQPATAKTQRAQTCNLQHKPKRAFPQKLICALELGRGRGAAGPFGVTGADGGCSTAGFSKGVSTLRSAPPGGALPAAGASTEAPRDAACGNHACTRDTRARGNMLTDGAACCVRHIVEPSRLLQPQPLATAVAAAPAQIYVRVRCTHRPYHAVESSSHTRAKTKPANCKACC